MSEPPVNDSFSVAGTPAAAAPLSSPTQTQGQSPYPSLAQEQSQPQDLLSAQSQSQSQSQSPFPSPPPAPAMMPWQVGEQDFAVAAPLRTDPGASATPERPAPPEGARGYRVRHLTRYRYGSPVTLSLHLLHLLPRPLPRQHISAQQLTLLPDPTSCRVRSDPFGNSVVTLAFEQPHRELSVDLDMTLWRLPRPPEQPGPPWEAVVQALVYQGQPLDDLHLEAQRYRYESPQVRVKRQFADYARDCFPAGAPLLDACRALTRRIHTDFTFDPAATDVATPLATVLEQRRGVCQDFAHLMLACLRSHGLAARYVSGYLLTQPPPGQPRLIGADATHAWVEVWCPVNGWVGFDPTNDCQPDLEHLVVGWGRDFTDVSPLRGVLLGGGRHDPEVAVTVLPLDDA